MNAVLGKHNFILLGLRGQAKARILRQLVDLLDPEIPVLEGSEVNDDPFAPISKYGRRLLEEEGDAAPNGAGTSSRTSSPCISGCSHGRTGGFSP